MKIWSSYPEGPRSRNCPALYPCSSPSDRLPNTSNLWSYPQMLLPGEMTPDAAKGISLFEEPGLRSSCRRTGEHTVEGTRNKGVPTSMILNASHVNITQQMCSTYSTRWVQLGRWGKGVLSAWEVCRPGLFWHCLRWSPHISRTKQRVQVNLSKHSKEGRYFWVQVWWIWTEIAMYVSRNGKINL